MNSARHNPATEAQGRLGELATLRDRWLDSLARDRAANTVLSYRRGVDDYLYWLALRLGRQLTVADANPMTIRAYRSLRESTMAPASVRLRLIALRVWWSWLHGHGLSTDNPAATVRPPRRGELPAPKGLSDSALHALIRAARDGGAESARNVALIQVAVQTGLRLGELCRLSVGDVQMGARSGAVLVRAAKRDGYRSVPLNASARAALLDYARARLLPAGVAAADALDAWSRYRTANPTAPLWLSRAGTRLGRDGIAAMLARHVALCAARGVVDGGATPHTLRHTFAHRYLAANPGDLVGLAQLMGHSSVTTTAIYTRQTAAELAARVETMDINAYGDERR